MYIAVSGCLLADLVKTKPAFKACDLSTIKLGLWLWSYFTLTLFL